SEKPFLSPPAAFEGWPGHARATQLSASRTRTERQEGTPLHSHRNLHDLPPAAQETAVSRFDYCAARFFSLISRLSAAQEKSETHGSSNIFFRLFQKRPNLSDCGGSEQEANAKGWSTRSNSATTRWKKLSQGSSSSSSSSIKLFSVWLWPCSVSVCPSLSGEPESTHTKQNTARHSDTLIGKSLQYF
ncbi:unnamed protein product, partial [Scytosiphon promiscuus]